MSKKKIVIFFIAVVSIVLLFSGFYNSSPNHISFEDIYRITVIKNHSVESGVVESGVSCLDLFNFGYANKTVIVNTQNEYEELFQDQIDRGDDKCSSAELKTIDFTKKTLLGQFGIGGCGDDVFDKEYFRDDEKKEAVYVVKHQEDDICDGLFPSMNWILVDKIPSDFITSFEIDFSPN